jgi:hemerythrin-like domain-containing protein
MLATEALKKEHRTIGRMLSVIQKAGNRLDAGQEAPPQMFRDATEFFLNFHETCHQSKEESAFFPTLEQVGVPRGFCPISVMLSEHQQARQLSRTLAMAADRFIQGDRRVRRTLILSIRDYVNLVRPHMIREDGIVFPMADLVLPMIEQQRLLSGFQATDIAVLGADDHKPFEVMLDKLERIVAAWPLSYESPFRA